MIFFCVGAKWRSLVSVEKMVKLKATKKLIIDPKTEVFMTKKHSNVIQKQKKLTAQKSNEENIKGKQDKNWDYQAPKIDQNWLKIDQKIIKNGSKMDQK